MSDDSTRQNKPTLCLLTVKSFMLLGQGAHPSKFQLSRCTITVALFEAHNRFKSKGEEPEDEYHFPVDVSSEGLLNAYFERENSDSPIILGQIFDQMEQHESELANAPLQT